MEKLSGKNCSADILSRETTEFRITASPLNPGFRLPDLLSEVDDCIVVKENNRRQVYHLQTPRGGYFLKRSTLVRGKDRRRHLILPRRKWAEWRNLHRLWYAGIPTAKPVLKGAEKGSHPKTFLLVTEKIEGMPLRIDTGADARRIGEFAAKLHSAGVLHADLHPGNIIMTPEGRACLLDVQEVYFLTRIPKRLRVHNLSKIYFNLDTRLARHSWMEDFLDGYNQNAPDHIQIAEIIKAAGRHQQRKYRSRSKRCCKNSTDFIVVKNREIYGYKRRGFGWGAKELRQALEKGQSLKEDQVIHYRNVCIKKRAKSVMHRNRCLVSWKMSRALEVRGIEVPCALGYFVMNGETFFLSEHLHDSLHLNEYLSSISDRREKRRVLKKLALWVRHIHDAGVWQRDFKSNNILCRQGNYYLIDLDGVKIRSLTGRARITNLAQLNASVSNAVTIRDRLRFFEYYTADEGISRRQKRKRYQEIWDITKTKATSIYGLYPQEFDLCRKSE